MRKVCLFVHKIYQNNRIFDEGNSQLNRNDVLAGFRKLRQNFRTQGFDLATQDIHSPEECIAVIYNEMPFKLPSDREKSYLLAFETELIKPDNWDPSRLNRFRTVFTAQEHKNLNTEAVKIQFPQPSKPVFSATPWNKKKLCTLVAGGKVSRHPLQLYSERIDWINWFTKNHPDEFDFYGTGWQQLKMTGSRFIRMFNAIPNLYQGRKPLMHLYKGPTNDKYLTLNQYKFSICFENAHSIPGYITEKIFDCFFSGNIPVYWGAPDIENYLPKDCFIDARMFKSKEELYTYMSSMPHELHRQMLINAENFLNSPKFQQFSIDHFAQTISNKVIKDLK